MHLIVYTITVNSIALPINVVFAHNDLNNCRVRNPSSFSGAIRATGYDKRSIYKLTPSISIYSGCVSL